MSCMNILIVEDNSNLQDQLKEVLSKEGYTIDVASTGTEALEKALSNTYGVILLDLLLPHMDGQKICQNIRARNIDTPVLMMTGHDSIDVRVQSLDCGADDYISKPFNIDELRARVRSLMRRQPLVENTKLLTYDSLSLDPNIHAAIREGKKITLSPNEWKLLEVFLRFPNSYISLEELHRTVWGSDDIPQSNILAVHIRDLRKKLNSGFSKDFIHNKRSVGYIFDKE